MVTVKSIPEGLQAVFPMLVCQSPEAEMNFCAAAFGAVEQVRRPGPDGSSVDIAMRITEPPRTQNQFWGDRTARILDQCGHVWIVASRIEETAEEQRAERWSDIREADRRD